MTLSTRLVDVMEGPRLIESWPCPLTTLAGGRAAALWRGVAYPLRPDGSIDVAAPFETAAPPGSHSSTPEPLAVIESGGATWVLVAGPSAALHRTIRALIRAGIKPARHGRWLGGGVETGSGPQAFDWYVRCTGQVPVEVQAELTAIALPEGASMFDQIAEIEAQLDRLRDATPAAAEQGAAPSGKRLLTDLKPPEPAVAESDASAEQISRLQTEIATLKQALEAQAAAAAARQTAPQPGGNKRAKQAEEFRSLVAHLVPHLTLLRDSYEVLANDYAERDHVWRALRELPQGGGRPNGWKSFRSAAKWWERHVSNGRDDTGRIYACYDPARQVWNVLMSQKADQANDTVWLRNRS